MPLEVTFDRQESGDCTSRVIFPDMAVSAALPAHELTTVRLDPALPGEFGFACGLNMIRGTLIVDADGGRVASDSAEPLPLTGDAMLNGDASAADQEAAEAAERRAELSDLSRRVIAGAVLALPVLFAIMGSDV